MIDRERATPKELCTSSSSPSFPFGRRRATPPPSPLFVKIRGESIDQSLTREMEPEKMFGGGAGTRAAERRRRRRQENGPMGRICNITPPLKREHPKGRETKALDEVWPFDGEAVLAEASYRYASHCAYQGILREKTTATAAQKIEEQTTLKTEGRIPSRRGLRRPCPTPSFLGRCRPRTRRNAKLVGSVRTRERERGRERYSRGVRERFEGTSAFKSPRSEIRSIRWSGEPASRAMPQRATHCSRPIHPFINSIHSHDDKHFDHHRESNSSGDGRERERERRRLSLEREGKCKCGRQ